MKYNRANGLLSFIFYSAISAIVFLIIYSLFFTPEIFFDSYDNIKQNIFKMDISKTNINNLNAETIIKQNNCLKQIDKKIEITKEKSLVKLTTKIREYQTFDNTEDALNFLEEWEYINGDPLYLGSNAFNFPEFYSNTYIPTQGNKIEIIEYDNIEITLIRIELNVDGNKVGFLTPVICIDNELRRFNI